MADTKSRIPVSIEALAVWAYRACYVHRMDRGVVGLDALEAGIGAAQDGILLHKSSGDGVVQCINQAVLGTKVDGGGLIPIRDAPADAKLLHGYVLTLEPAVQNLVVGAACLGGWPNWMPEARADGLRVVWRTIDGREQVHRTSGPAASARVYCPVEIVDDSLAVKRARERYSQWWYALYGAKALFTSKPDLLTRHRVVRQDAPRCPWERVGGDVKDFSFSRGNAGVRASSGSTAGKAA